MYISVNCLAKRIFILSIFYQVSSLDEKEFKNKIVRLFVSRILTLLMVEVLALIPSSTGHPLPVLLYSLKWSEVFCLPVLLRELFQYSLMSNEHMVFLAVSYNPSFSGYL